MISTGRLLWCWFLKIAVAVFVIGPYSTVATAQQKADTSFLQFVRRQAAELRGSDQPAAGIEEWRSRRMELLSQLERAWGDFPAEKCDLNPQVLGTLARDGYRIEKIIFQTMPDVWMTANAYVPDRPGPLPAVLCVHGHWKLAKQEPDIQSRCIGLAKLGFFVLVVDALGAGERGLGKNLGEYHGEMVAGTLFPVGLTLCGLQVYENMRAVDYLQTRPEVDPQRLGITGASGGGNQTMYAGAYDQRIQAVVPVCSIGNYQAYLGAACCYCEVVPGALQFTEEGEVLSLIAPRDLMIISASEDAPQFSPEEAKKSIQSAAPIFRHHGPAVQGPVHTVIASPHAYNQQMREAMYGWMKLHLQEDSKGDWIGTHLAEPAHTTEDPETLRCYPGQSRPDDWTSIPQIAARAGRAQLAHYNTPEQQQQWSAGSKERLQRLEKQLLRGTRPVDVRVIARSSEAPPTQVIQFEPEPGVLLELTYYPAMQTETEPKPNALVLMINLEAEWTAEDIQLSQALQNAGGQVAMLNLRATGARRYARDTVGRAPDHTTAEWAMWLGRPLLGQWVLDVRAALEVLSAEGLTADSTIVYGYGPAGIVAATSAALEEQITGVVLQETLTSYVTDQPYFGQRAGILVPGIVRDFGDVPQLLACLAPRKVLVVGGTSPQGQSRTAAEIASDYEFATRVYELKNSANQLKLLARLSAEDLAVQILKP